jgi:tRNA-dependent cyclodipeptide synthase
MRCDISDARLFIPISLGNHYYSKSRLRNLLQDIILPSAASTIFLCDQLRHLSYLIKGETDEVFVSKRVTSQLGEMRAMLSHCGYDEPTNLEILSWQTVANEPRLKQVEAGVNKVVQTDCTLSWQADIACRQLLNKFACHDISEEQGSQLQRQYLICETSLSIYMNECMGYDYEVYRREGGFIDFIYETRPEEVRRISGGSAKRKLLSLENYWEENLS